MQEKQSEFQIMEYNVVYSSGLETALGKSAENELLYFKKIWSYER